MTTGRTLKRRVRARMARTGEKYTAALRAVQQAAPEPAAGREVDFDGEVRGDDELRLPPREEPEA